MLKPNRFNTSQLSKVGVELMDKQNTILRCKECGQGWLPMLQNGGRLPNNYWKCPNGCNENN